MVCNFATSAPSPCWCHFSKLNPSPRRGARAAQRTERARTWLSPGARRGAGAHAGEPPGAPARPRIRFAGRTGTRVRRSPHAGEHQKKPSGRDTSNFNTIFQKEAKRIPKVLEGPNNKAVKEGIHLAGPGFGGAPCALRREAKGCDRVAAPWPGRDPRRPCGWGGPRASGAGPRAGRPAGGAGRCLPLPVLPPPLPGPSRAPSPFRVRIRAAFSRGPHGAQLTGRVVYGPSSACSRRPPAARASVSARPFVRAAPHRGPEPGGRGCSAAPRARRSRDGARAKVVRARSRAAGSSRPRPRAPPPPHPGAVPRALPGAEGEDARSPAPLGRQPRSMSPARPRRAL